MITEKRKTIKALIFLIFLFFLFLIHSAVRPHLRPHPRRHTHILIVILSTPANHLNREVLRRNSYLGYPWSFKNSSVNFTHVFVCGDSGDSHVNNDVIREAQLKGDIAIGNYVDSYENLSEKVIWGFEYALANYNFDFLVKVDEDSFVNMEYLAQHLAGVKAEEMALYYAGKPRQGSLEVPKSGKFKVDNWEQGKISEYVQYNLGGGYILSSEATSKILTVHYAGVVEPIKWEDVYIGMLAYLIGMPPIRIYHYYVSKFYPFCTDVKTILLHHTKPELQARMLNHYHATGMYCPKDLTVEQVLDLMNSYEIVDWLKIN